MAGAVSPTIKIEAFVTGAAGFEPTAFQNVGGFDVGGFESMDLSGDLVAAAGMSIQYGIQGNTPKIMYPSVGECKFTLRNDAGGSGGVQGYYSPRHPSRRVGWTTGLNCQVTLTYAGTPYVKHYGKIVSIIPVAGKYAQQRVEVISQDIVADLLAADASAVAIAANVTETQVISAVLDSVPVAAQPLARDLDVGLESFAVVFDKATASIRALPSIRDAALSALGRFFVKGDGTFCYRTRHSLALAPSSLTLNDSMHGLEAPSLVDKLFNRFRATVHPKSTSIAATDLLYTLPAGDATILVPAGSSIDVWCDYSDPNNRTALVGGDAVVTALVPNTHYTANTTATGSGADLTANITPTLTPYGARAKYTLANGSLSGAYMTLLKIFGKAVRDPGPQTAETVVAQTYGDRLLDVDLVFQNSLHVAQDIITYLSSTWSTLQDVVDLVSFVANSDTALMIGALSLEPCSAITVTETVSGIATLRSLITSIELVFDANGFMHCTWGLLPSATSRMWQWGIVGSSEWGSGTVYGY